MAEVLVEVTQGGSRVEINSLRETPLLVASRGIGQRLSRAAVGYLGS